MPIYDYRCTGCGHEVEVVHGIDAAGPSSCEVCGGAMRKALSAPAIHFKGSGWAKKDAQVASKARSKLSSPASGKGTAGRAADTSSLGEEGSGASGSAKSGDSSTTPASTSAKAD